MPPKSKKGSKSQQQQQQQQQSQMAKQEKMMQQMNTMYEKTIQESLQQPPGPLDVLMSATPVLLLGVFSVSTFCRWYFKETKPISQQKLLEILSTAYRTWGYALSEGSKQEQNVIAQNPNMTPEDKKAVTAHFRFQITQQLAQAEQELLQQANTSPDQIQEAIKVYEGDKQVSKLVNDLNKLVATVIPPPPLPYPWTENDVLTLLAEIFEIRISTMEEAYQALKYDERPKGLPLTPQMAEDLNQLFNETLTRRLQDFYSSKKVTAPLLQKFTRSVNSSPNYIDLVHATKQEQQQRYAAMGLEVKKR
jgi:hypothetical protein